MDLPLVTAETRAASVWTLPVLVPLVTVVVSVAVVVVAVVAAVAEEVAEAVVVTVAEVDAVVSGDAVVVDLEPVPTELLRASLAPR